jgi:catechol 2,3-dioxygenase-like lactoylglutathione lyase family enzyme
MSEFGTLSEVIVYVREMDRMASFYTDVLGLEIAAGDPEHGFVEFDTGTCSLCLHAGREDDPGDAAPKFVFGVEDVEEARAYLHEHDVELGEVRSPAPGKRVCDGLDPEGNAFAIESSTAPE